MFEELRAEYLAETMGSRITERVRSLLEAMLRKRDPVIYARGARDYRDALDDVLHDFTIDVLLHEGQLSYAFDNAADVNGFDRIINRQLRRYLARTHERSIVDNLIERSVRLVADLESVVLQGEGDHRSFVLASDTTEPAGVSFAHAALMAGNAVPKIYSNPDERNPKVYTDENLRTLLRVFLSEYRMPVRTPELQELFELLLTPWTTSVLGLDEVVGVETLELTPEEQVMVNMVAERITESWTELEAVVFRYKLGNLPDAELANRLGVSRPTAANAKSDLFSDLARELMDVDQHVRPAIITKIADLTCGRAS